MTLRINKEAGKGDKRRATQNDEAYRNNYDLIFGKKTKDITCTVCDTETVEDSCKGENPDCPVLTKE